MIEYIKGILTELNPTEAVVEAAGVGYDIAITLPTYSALVGKEEAYPQQCSTDGHRQSDRAELFTRKRRE